MRLSLAALTSLSLLSSTALSIPTTTHVVHEKRDVPLAASVQRLRVDGEAVLPLRIGLTQNHDAVVKAEKWLMDVSDPNSSNYGKHWSQDDVVDKFQPSDKAVKAVKKWLSASNITNVTHSDNKQWLAANVPASKVEALLQTKYFVHENEKGHSTLSCDEYSVHADVQKHVDYVSPGVKGITVSKSPATKQARSITRRQFSLPPPGWTPPAPNDLTTCWDGVTPACIRAMYGFEVADPADPVCADNKMGIFEQSQLYEQFDLDNFFSHYTTIPNGTSPVDLLIDGGQSPPSNESSSTFSQVQGEAILDLITAMPIIYPQNATIFQVDDYYWSTTYPAESSHGVGLFDTFLDAIDGSYCSFSAYNQTGDSSIDPQYPDTHASGYKGKLQCGVFQPTPVISISYSEGEADLPASYQKRQCLEWLKLGLQGVSAFIASGDQGATTSRVCSVDKPLAINFAANCPWITSVGGTQMLANSSLSDPQEAWPLSTGGFSWVFPAPYYQTDAISHYFATTSDPFTLHNSTTSPQNVSAYYNRNGRGIPDLSAIALDLVSSAYEDILLQSGTSASTPIVAALFTRINEERMRAGKKAVGFVNPVLYQSPQVFTDITTGNNSGGCVGGWKAGAGWDSVTGLGTPKYDSLLEVFMGLP